MGVGAKVVREAAEEEALQDVGVFSACEVLMEGVQLPRSPVRDGGPGTHLWGVGDRGFGAPHLIQLVRATATVDTPARKYTIATLLIVETYPLPFPQCPST